ncbi:MAG: NTP transferase domain-containing protein [Patescibacteria group bacterium]
MSRIAAVILAAGKGTRMNESVASPIPKVMFEINGVPMIRFSVDNVRRSGLVDIYLVVGYKQELVRKFLGEEVRYAVQEEQLGTGHALAAAKDRIEGKFGAVFVCYGDMPLFGSETIQDLIRTYEEEKPTIALLSVDFAEPKKWAYGRIIRENNGNVAKIVEQKDCTFEQLEIIESNTGVYIFDAGWLWANIAKIQTNNVQKEYYLTDLVEIARSQQKRVVAVKVPDEREALGINTPEQLEIAREVIGGRQASTTTV